MKKKVKLGNYETQNKKRLPRKLKKKYKKSILSSFSENYIKYRRIKLKQIRLLYVDDNRNSVGFEIIK